MWVLCEFVSILLIVACASWGCAMGVGCSVEVHYANDSHLLFMLVLLAYVRMTEGV